MQTELTPREKKAAVLITVAVVVGFVLLTILCFVLGVIRAPSFL